MADCLATAEIEGLLADTLSAADKARAEGHLAVCEKCRQEVARRRADDELFGKIKRAYEAETLSKRDQPVDSHTRPTPPTESIEGYEILSEVHRGGQGVVYKAVQKATKRTVALKVLLEGPYASPRQRHRFEREIDLVASLQHPNIVTVYDSGVTRDGRHFFAMEYIHGQPLDAYLSDKNLSIDETLRLFQRICGAVNHAHQHGVIHRDLKPGNIRVGANGEPHVLDFGLAKAGAAALTPDGAPVTVTGEFMGTLAYASPEQTKGDPTLIDIRTDVYSLGVILYEMLTGKYPYQVVGQMADVLRNIAEVEPKKPSTIRRQINDEVETIILKALAKEKERRYQSADTLGRDIEHYLSGQPIDAKRDSGWYVLKKALHRYKAPASVAAGYLVIVTIALLACLALWKQATEQRDRARLAEGDAKQAQAVEAEARQAEAGQRRLAESERDRALAAEEEARQHAYAASILAADQALQLDDVPTAMQRLDAAYVGLRNWEWRYLRGQIDQPPAIFHGGASVLGVACSANDNLIAGAAFDGGLTVWDRATEEIVARWTGQTEWRYATNLAFSPDGSRIAATYPMARLAVVWNFRSRQDVTVIREDSQIHTLAWEPSGVRLATGGNSGISVWTLEPLERMVKLEDTGSVMALRFCSKSQIVSVNFEGLVKLWDIDTSTVLSSAPAFEDNTVDQRYPSFARTATITVDCAETAVAVGTSIQLRPTSAVEHTTSLQGHQTPVTAAAFTPDANYLASGSRDGIIRLWDISTRETIRKLGGHTDEISSITFSADGTLLISGSEDDSIRVWNATTAPDIMTLHPEPRKTYSVSFSPDGARLATLSTPGGGPETYWVVTLWNAATGARVAVLPRQDRPLGLRAPFSPNGKLLAVAADGNTAILCSATTGDKVTDLVGHTDLVTSIAFAPKDDLVISGSSDGTVRVWAATDGKEKMVLRGHESGVGHVAVSPSGDQIISVGENAVKVWNSATGKEMGSLTYQPQKPISLAFTPDGTRILLATGARPSIIFWDATTYEHIIEVPGFVPSLDPACSPDGTVLALISPPDVENIQLLSTQTGQLETLLVGHKKAVNSLAFSPDGTRCVTGGEDRTTRVWDRHTGAELLTLRGHSGGVGSVAFSPDGTKIASAGRKVIVWTAIAAK